MKRWYQNVAIKGKTLHYEDPNREHSKFWNKGKWNTFIKPLLPRDCSGKTFVELGCNAGLFLHLAEECGFGTVVGVDSNSKALDQATQFRDVTGGNYSLLQQRIGENFDLTKLPVADVILLSNIHYHLPIHDFSILLDNIRGRTASCIVVSAKVGRGGGKAVHTIDGVRGYFSGWPEEGRVLYQDESGDPAPRERMYSIKFKGALSEYDASNLLATWRRDSRTSPEAKRSELVPALDEFFPLILSGAKYASKELLFFKYWKTRNPALSADAIKEKIENKRKLALDIKENGSKKPIYIDRRGRLLDGAHRLYIHNALGHKTILVRNV